MSSPKISVIIPTYDRRHYLGLAIRSVLDQTYRDFELIVVDDGSTDGTEAFVRQIADPRIRYQRQPHGGIGAAMNAGIRAARADLVARLDSDDVWFPELLAIEAAEMERRPEIAMVYAKGQAMDAQGRPLTHTQGFAERFSGETFRSMLYDDFTCNITTLARRECLERAGLYDETLSGNEDWDLWLRMARFCRFGFVDRVLARFRWHEGNLTGLHSAGFATVLACRSRVLDKVFSRNDLPDDIVEMKPLAYRNVYTFAGLRFLQARRFGEASRYFGRALRTGANPAVTALRIVWFAGVGDWFGRPAWGRYLTRTRASRQPPLAE